MGLLRTLTPLKLIGGSAQMLSVTFVPNIEAGGGPGSKHRISTDSFVGRKLLSNSKSHR